MNEKLVSFAATIAYGWLSLALLVIAALWMGSPYAVMCGLLACGAAYIAQLIYTQPEGIGEVRIGAAFQILSLALWLKDRKVVGEGQSVLERVDLGGGRNIKKK